MGGSNAQVRVFHVDDNPGEARLLSAFLKIEPKLEFAGSAHNSDDLISRVTEARADVVVIDLLVPGTDQVREIEQLHAALPSVRIVTFSGCDDPDLLDQASRAGAAAHVRKGDGFERVLRAIQAVGEEHPPSDLPRDT